MKISPLSEFLGGRLRSKTGKAIGGTGLIRLACMVVAFACSVLLARVQGVEQFGVYSYVIGLVSLIGLIPQYGLPSLVMRETARARQAAEWGLMKGLWRWSFHTCIKLCLLAVFLGVAVYYLWVSAQNGEISQGYLWGLILIPLVALARLRAAALRGLQYPVRSQLPENLLRPLFLAGFVLLFLLAGHSLSALSAIKFHLLAAAITFVLGTLILWRSKPEQLSGNEASYRNAGSWLAAIIPLGALGTLQMSSQQIDIIMIGSMLTPTETGVYKVFVSTATLIMLGLQIVSLVLGPRIAGYLEAGDQNAVQRNVTYAVLAGLLFAVPVSGLFLFGGRFLISAVYGQEFVQTYSAFQLLVLTQLINVAFGCTATLLNMARMEKSCLVWFGLATVVNIVGNYFLIPILGINGVAISTMISVIVWNLAYCLLGYKKLGINTSFLSLFGERKYL